MPADREARATLWSGRATWLVVIGMALALAGASLATLPVASAQDESTPKPASDRVIVTSPTSRSAYVVAHPMACPSDVDLAVAATDPEGMGCVTLPYVTYRFVYHSEPESAVLAQERSSGTAADAHPVGIYVDAGTLSVHELVSPRPLGAPAYQPPRVFCWKWDRSGDPWYANYEITYVRPSSTDGRSSYLFPTFNHPGHREECLWLRQEVVEVPPTPTLPALEIDPDEVIEEPVLPVTPVVPIQLPTATPELPQVEITPPAQIPDPILTPVIELPTPTPTPEIGEPPVIVITPVIEVPIEIVTPIVIPVVPTPTPELIHRAPGGIVQGFGRLDAISPPPFRNPTPLPPAGSA